VQIETNYRKNVVYAEIGDPINKGVCTVPICLTLYNFPVAITHTDFDFGLSGFE